jgi:hypothetical protein
VFDTHKLNTRISSSTKTCSSLNNLASYD